MYSVHFLSNALHSKEKKAKEMNANCIRPNNRPKTINNEKLLEAEIVYILSQISE